VALPGVNSKESYSPPGNQVLKNVRESGEKGKRAQRADGQKEEKNSV